MDIDSIRQVKKMYEEELFEKPRVVGVGIGYKKIHERRTKDLSIKVYVKEKLPRDMLKPNELIPTELGGVPTDIDVAGEIFAYGNLHKLQISRNKRQRPAVPGISIGHYQITAGTFGAVCVDKKGSDRLILSNNHVIACSNKGKIGDPILQPGRYDGGRLDEKRKRNGGWNYDDEFDDDVIAQLKAYIPIKFYIEESPSKLARSLAKVGNIYPSTFNFLAKLLKSKHRLTKMSAVKFSEETNELDAATALPIKPEYIGYEIVGIGVPQGVRDPEVGLEVKKSGRTTGVTSGKIDAIDATVNVSYGEDGYAKFVNQIVTNGMSRPGDSGSLLVDNKNYAVGLLFAGSYYTTIYNPIKKVLDSLYVDLLTG